MKEHQRAPDGHPGHGAPAPRRLPRIVLAEGDRTYRELFRSTLQDEGYDVTAVQAEPEALREALASHPDLLVIDLQIPPAGGIDLLHQLWEHDLHAPCILTSGCTLVDEGFETWCADACVSKSPDLQELKGEVRALTRRVVPEASIPPGSC